MTAAPPDRSAGFGAQRGAAPAPKSGGSVQAKCPSCNKLGLHTEGMKERRRADFSSDVFYFFECPNCKARTDKLLDETGTLHKWTGNRHTAYKPGT